jgi:hypothetical protein
MGVVLLHVSDWRYQLPELGMMLKLTPYSFMKQTNSFEAHQNRNFRYYLKTFLKWIYGYIFLLGGFCALAVGNLFLGLCLILAGSLIIPATLAHIETRLKYKFKRIPKYALIYGLLVVGITFTIAKSSKKAGDSGKEIDSTGTKTISGVDSKESDALTTDSINTNSAATSQKEEQSVSDRKEEIEKQFSPWSGAHLKLERYIKHNLMNDPDSYEHVVTQYWDRGDFLMVSTKFRGKNAFGGLVISHVSAKVDLDGNVIKIISTD